MGRIIELIPGADGKIRTAKVKTSKGILLRPLQRLYPLEIRNDDLPQPSLEDQGVIREVKATKMKRIQEKNDLIEEELAQPERTRFGRISKKPQRFGNENISFMWFNN